MCDLCVWIIKAEFQGQPNSKSSPINSMKTNKACVPQHL